MPSNANQVRRNSFFSLLSSVIRLGTNFLLFVGIARFYGAETFGQFTTAHTFSIMFTLFADFGFDTLLATEISRNREQSAKLAQQYLSIKLVFCTLATVAMLFIPSFKAFSEEASLLIYIFSFYVFFSSMNNYFFALFKGYEELHHETRISFVINIFLLVLLGILGAIHVSIMIIAIIFVASRVLGLFIAIISANKVVKGFSFQLDFSGRKQIMPQITVFGLHYLFGNLFFQLDTILLSLWKGDHEVGVYQSVFKLVALSLVLSDVAVSALLPTLSRLHAEHREQWHRLGSLLSRTLLFIAIPIVLLMLIYADQIIHLLYGNQTFLEAVPLLRIFAFIVLTRYIVETYALLLTTSRRQTARMLIVVSATILNFFLNMYFIPKYGVYGAAMVSLATNIFVGILYILNNSKIFFELFLNIKLMVPGIITLILAICLWPIKTNLPILYAPLIIFGLGLVIYNMGYTIEERKMIFNLRGGLING